MGRLVRSLLPCHPASHIVAAFSFVARCTGFDEYPLERPAAALILVGLFALVYAAFEMHRQRHPGRYYAATAAVSPVIVVAAAPGGGASGDGSRVAAGPYASPQGTSTSPEPGGEPEGQTAPAPLLLSITSIVRLVCFHLLPQIRKSRRCPR